MFCLNNRSSCSRHPRSSSSNARYVWYGRHARNDVINGYNPKKSLLHLRSDFFMFSEYFLVIADKPPTIADKNSKIADKPPTIADKNSKIADKPSTIADKPSTIADKPPTTADKDTNLLKKLRKGA